MELEKTVLVKDDIRYYAVMWEILEKWFIFKPPY